MLGFIKEFINLHSDSAAQERRRNNLEYCGGFTQHELKNFICKRFEETTKKVVSLSVTTIGRAFEPPNKQRNSSSSYLSLFDVKILGG
jgi:hypothetical protein